MKNGEISENTVGRYGGGVYTDYFYTTIGGFSDYYGTFRIGGGVIYGNNAVSGIKNTANNGVALYRNSTSVAQYGTFNEDTFYKSGDLSTTDITIRVVNGNLLTE